MLSIIKLYAIHKKKKKKKLHSNQYLYFVIQDNIIIIHDCLNSISLISKHC
jgi:hypothetical protein